MSGPKGVQSGGGKLEIGRRGGGLTGGGFRDLYTSKRREYNYRAKNLLLLGDRPIDKN